MYYRPRADARSELTERKSRFIGYLHRCECRDDAIQHIEKLRKQHPDARHLCWAFRIGAPDAPHVQSWSDDGEPAGTAGKPMLNVLCHKPASDTLAVVVRYFGGVKLGAGGLVRAYSGALAQTALQTLWDWVEPSVPMSFSLAYSHENHARYWLDQHNVAVITVVHASDVQFEVRVSVTLEKELRQWLHAMSGGTVNFLSTGERCTLEK